MPIIMKKVLAALFAVALGLNINAQVPDYVPTEGLVGWWPLDGNADDQVGTNDGILIGCTESENRFEMSGKALEFDGLDDHISLDTYFNGQMMSSVSYSIWLNTIGSETDQYVSGKEGFWRSIYILISETNSIGFGGTSQGVYFGLSSDDNIIQLGNWHHFVVTFEESMIKLFLDGLLIAEGPSSASLLDYQFYAAGNSTATNYVGARHPVSPGICHFFNGSLDDFGLWNRALTEEEVLALYNADPPITGCTDPTACNYNEEATSDDGGCIPSGCMETEACNYNALAECEGEECDYTCCPGPGCCSAGMFWDYELEQCMNYETCQEDLDGDGVIGVNDLMQLLSSFGTDCAQAEEPETTEFTCGDPVSYHGYDYTTVQIGDQCWFAENLRTELYANSDSIPANLINSVWQSTTSGAQMIYANSSGNLEQYGRLYNWYAVNDERQVCPSGWHVPTDEQFKSLEMYLGMSESDANSTGWDRGTDEGAQLKASASDSPSWNGSNISGFHGLSGGQRFGGGDFGDDQYGLWWSGTDSSGSAWTRILSIYHQTVKRDVVPHNHGLSIRCLKDAE